MVKRSYASSFGPLASGYQAYKKKKSVHYVRRNRAPRVKGAIRSRKELKYNDLGSNSYNIDTTGSVTALNLLAVGDDNTNRDGRQVTIKSIQITGVVKPFDDTTGDSHARVMLVWDNAVNSGAIATIAQILTAANSNSFPLIDNAQRFTILSDMHYAVGKRDNTATQTFAASPSVHALNMYKKLNLVTQYSGTTAVIASIQNGALLLVTIGDQAVNTGALLQCATRVRFTDD